MPDLSVSIVNTGSRELMLACLASLAGTDAEIVVLDNASEDGSVAAVRERFPGVRVIAQPYRAGFGANHNTVIRDTSGRYVYVLNEDTTADDWGFDALTAYLNAHPRVAALGPRLVYPDGRLQDSAWRFPTPLVSTLSLATLGRLGVTQSRGDAPRAVDWVMGAAVALRREALEEVGLFDEDFFLYSEEVDLQARLHRAGWEVHYFPRVTVVHHESQFSADIPERRINEMWRSRHRYWRKHHSGTAAAPWMPFFAGASTNICWSAGPSAPSPHATVAEAPRRRSARAMSAPGRSSTSDAATRRSQSPKP